MSDFSEKELDVLERHGLVEQRWADGARVATVTREEAWQLHARYPAQLRGLFDVSAAPPAATEEERLTRARYPTMFEK